MFEFILSFGVFLVLVGVDRRRRKCDATASVVATNKNRVHDAILAGLADLLTPRVELPMKSINAPVGNGLEKVVSDTDQIDF